jgi:hypothetical protein
MRLACIAGYAPPAMPIAAENTMLPALPAANNI